jgi:hypothetical protein
LFYSGNARSTRLDVGFNDSFKFQLHFLNLGMHGGIHSMIRFIPSCHFLHVMDGIDLHVRTFVAVDCISSIYTRRRLFSSARSEKLFNQKHRWRTLSERGEFVKIALEEL